MAELNETKLADEILGINNGADEILGINNGEGEAGSNALPSGSGPVPSGDPRKYGLDHLSFDEAAEAAHKKFLQFSSIFYKTNEDYIYSESELAGLDQQKLQYIIYDTYIRNIDKKFDPNPNMATMCTNGETIYMNPWFVAALKPEEILFILAHEINHIKLMHAGDKNRFNIFITGSDQTVKPNDLGVSIRAKISNIVTDLIINDSLIDDKIGSFPKDPISGENFGLHIQGYAEFTSEEGIMEFTNLLVKRGLTEIPRILKEKYGREITNIPTIPEATTLSGARRAIDAFIEFLKSLEDDLTQIVKDQLEQGQGQGQGNPGRGDVGGGQGSSGGQEQDNGTSQSGVPGERKKDSEQEGAAKQGKGQKGKGSKSGINDMVDSALNSVIESIINKAMQNELSKALGSQLSKGGGDGTGSGSGQRCELSDKDIEEIMDKLAKALADGDLIFGDHEMQDKLVEIQGKLEGMSADEMKESIKEGVVLITEQTANNLERAGLTMDKIAGLGHIGRDMYRVWKERQFKPERPYDKMLQSLFDKIDRGNQSATYAKYNRRTTVLNAANRRLAQMGGYEPSTIIIPSKRSIEGKIVIAIDVSGSIYSDPMSMGMAFSEIIRLADVMNQNFSRCDIEIVRCDTETTWEGPYAGGSAELDEYIENIKKHGINLGGGGGTNLLPVWEDIIEEAEDTGKMPAGLLFVTDTMTNNSKQITELYDSGKFNVPTVILYPDDEYLNSDFEELASRNPDFLLANIRELLKKDKEMGFDIEM